MSLARKRSAMSSSLAMLSYFTLLAVVQAADNPPRQDGKLAALSKTKTGPAKIEKLIAGNIRADILSENVKSPYSVGAFVFTEIEVKNTKSKENLSAEIFLEPDGAEIRSVTGKNVSYNPKKDNKTVTLSKLKKGKPVKILVELRLNQAEQARNDRHQSRLKITLRQSDESETSLTDSTSLTWKIQNCAANYHNELVKIHDENANLLKEIIPRSRTRNRSLPGRWLFNTRSNSTGSRRRCLKTRLVYSSRRDRYYRRCVRYARQRAQNNAGSSAKISREQAKVEREIYRMANRFVHMRGIDPELRTTRDSGWVTRRVSIDLRKYLGQKPNPAICSGAIRMVEYFDKRLGDVRKRARNLDELTGKARELAYKKVQRINETLAEAEGGHPGFGQIPLATIGKNLRGTSNLRNMIVYTGNLYAQIAQIDPPQLSSDIFQSLATMKKTLRHKLPKEIPGAFKTAQLRALTMIEAAAYLNLVNSHYEDLRKSIDGSLASIRTAHKQACTCDN